MTDEEYLARLGLLRLQSGKRKPQEPVPAGSSVLDVPVGGTRRIPDTVLRRPAQPEDTITGLPEPSMAQRHAESLAGYLTPKVGGPRARAIAQTALGGDESALPFGIGLQELVPFSPYVAEEAGRMVRSGVETGSPLEIGLGLGLGALQASPAAKPIARGAKAVGKRVREAADPEAIRQYVRQTQGLTGMPGTAVIKPKGGNWLTGDIEKQTKPLKRQFSPSIEQDIEGYRAGQLSKAEESERLGYTTRADQFREDVAEVDQAVALNNWIDKKLNKYIRNEMGTPEDPVRKLAEQDILHFEPQQVFGDAPSTLMRKRAEVGMPTPLFGQSEMARRWESLADRAIDPFPAGSYKYGSLDESFLASNPWLEKVPDEAMVYKAKGLRRDMGFDHLIDELRNATRADSDLPAHLRWKPEDLDKVTMEQAVKRVHDINEYRAAKKAEANEALARNPATAPYKDYQTVPGTDKPNEKGLAWKQIKQPGELPEGWVERGGNVAGPEGAVAIRGSVNDPRRKALEDALKYEGEVMGHCVGGYCDDVLSGRSQIYSLRDKKGEPHVTIEVEPGPRLGFRPGEGPKDAQEDYVLRTQYADDLEREAIQGNVTFAEWWRAKNNIPEPPREMQITQIKGKANRAPKEEYLPFVQDFVRSGNWSRVGDIQNTGLYRKSDFIDEFTSDQLDAVGKGEYLTMNEIKKLREGKAWKPIDTRPEFDLPDDLLPPAQNYAAGGLVQNTDALRDKLIAAGMDPEQAMMQALRMADQVEMAEGGSVKAAQDWRRKLVGGGIRGIVTRGLLGMDPPEDMTPRERDIYENMVRLSAPAQGLGVGKAIFIGAKAKTWNKSAADRFVEMEKAGVSPEKMWRETGTFRGADGKLRQEISDVGAIHRNPAQLQELGKAKKEEAKELQLRMVTPIGQKDLFPKALTEAKKPVREQVKKLKDEADELMRHSDVRGQSARFVLEHPELYKAYPELADIPVMQGVSGSGRGSLIGAGPDLQMSITQQGLRHDPKSTALHEMQHAVQALEEMAPGGSPAMAFQNPKAFEILQELRAKASTPMSFEKFVEQYGSNANNAGRYEEYLKSIPQTVAGLERQLQQTAAMEYYKRLAGEAEARATQFREKMGPTQRLQEFPYSSYDVLPEDLIVRPPKGAGMGEGMQAGGLAKLIKGAAKKAKAAEPSKPSFKGPQDEAMETARKNAVKMLGLPENNTAMDRARAMGFDTPGFRGTTVEEVSHQKPIWWSEDPEYASAYAAHTVRPPKGQPDPYAGNVMPLLVKQGKSKEFERFTSGGVPLDPFSGFKEGVETGFRRYAQNDITGDMGGKIWEGLTVPQNVRSRFAAFDPARVNENDLLGAADPALLAGVAVASGVGLGALKQTEKRKPKQEEQKKTRGGLAKAAKAAVAELKGNYKALPLNLPRAPAMTQQEIEQIAERIARQQLGEHVRKPGDTKNLAGRSLKEAERLKKLSYSLESTKTPPLEKVVPEKKGQVRVALPGDISVADKILVEVEGLPIGALQQGGPKYGAGKMDLPDPRFWASNVGPASNLQRKIDDLAMVYETPEVLAEHMAMGSTGMNFAQHLANANLMAINSSMPHPKAVEQFNKVIRKGFFDPVSKTQVEFPDFPGVENYKASYQALKEDPELRKWFNNRMKTEDVTAPLNFPRGKDIEYAISEPELRDLEIGMTGLSVGQMQPGASLIKQSAHKTYSHDIPGLYLGRTQELLPVELAFPDASAFIKSTKRPADFTTTMQKVFPHQVVDEQYINELGEYYDKLRKIRGFNEGGVVKPEGADDFAKQVMQKIANQQVSA